MAKLVCYPLISLHPLPHHPYPGVVLVIIYHTHYTISNLNIRHLSLLFCSPLLRRGQCLSLPLSRRAPRLSSLVTCPSLVTRTVTSSPKRQPHRTLLGLAPASLSVHLARLCRTARTPASTIATFRMALAMARTAILCTGAAVRVLRDGPPVTSGLALRTCKSCSEFYGL